MPSLTVEQAIEQFNTSALQAVSGCGQPNQYKVTESTNRILLTHPDGCRLDYPFEAIVKLSTADYDKVFGALTLTPEHAELLAELRGDMTTDLPNDAPLPEVTVDRALFTAATGTNRFAAVRAMTRGNLLPFPMLPLKDLNRRVSKRARGRIFIKSLAKLGVTLPDELALPVGDVLHAMYSAIEGNYDTSNRKLREITMAHQDWQEQVRREMQATTDAVTALEVDVAKTLALRTAAIAWRTSFGTPEEKLEMFNKLMDSIDRVVEEAPAVPMPNVDHEFPPADLLARHAAEDALTEAVPTADAEQAR